MKFLIPLLALGLVACTNTCTPPESVPAQPVAVHVAPAQPTLPRIDFDVPFLPSFVDDEMCAEGDPDCGVPVGK